MSNMKPAGYLNKFTGMIWNSEQQPGAENEPETYEPLVRLSDVHGLVAESEALKERNRNNLKFIAEELGDPEFRAESVRTPNTDAAIAEIKASELDDLAKSIMEYAPVIESDEYHVYEVIAKDVTDRAANLRARRKG